MACRILLRNPPASRPPPKTAPSEAVSSDGAFNIASILCLSMLFSKISRKNPRTPLRRTLPRRFLHRPHRTVSMITPVNPKPTPNQAGDIYYSTLLRFVKPFREDFSIFLRHRLRPHPSWFHRQAACFEENTGSSANRHHIIYTQFHALSSRFREKYEK